MPYQTESPLTKFHETFLQYLKQCIFILLKLKRTIFARVSPPASSGFAKIATSLIFTVFTELGKHAHSPEYELKLRSETWERKLRGFLTFPFDQN